ncbi:MAG TPA: isomerizing glutamine--fructose-6-phosphate transaminase, partial [Planctomycetaceae bacterium]|nr:isomerizing glutamine--fructose-6-phosphate transaminase [Planctomycetaceae bacterium]
MCGIVGYVGYRSAQDIILEGLHRLEYRGYDSAGVAIARDGRIGIRKKAGRVQMVAAVLDADPLPGTVGIGHTRWATHGATTDVNSHPHVGGNGEVVLVHNGVIENHAALRSQLQELGYVFRTQTDTEVIAHLIAHHLDEQLRLDGGAVDQQTCLTAIEQSLLRLNGTYGLGILFRDLPNTIFGARLGSPLVVGVGHDEFFLASDSSPLIGYTEEVVYLADHEIAVLRPEGMQLLHRDSGLMSPSVHTLDQVMGDADRGGFEHYMLKEIFEQPQTVENAMRGRLDEDEATAKFGGLNVDPQQLRRIDRIVLTACGTSWHAGLVGEYLLEEFTRIPTEVEYASELRYRNPPMTDTT